jgi:hypothetical protein
LLQIFLAVVIPQETSTQELAKAPYFKGCKESLAGRLTCISEILLMLRIFGLLGPKSIAIWFDQGLV